MKSRKIMSVLLGVTMLSVAAPAAFGHGDGGGSYSGGSWGGSYDRDQNRPDRAVSYINPDIGAATFNPDVNANSSCFNPDRYDVQRLSDSGTTNRNVHNDACFFDYPSSSWGSYGGSSGSPQKVDGPASFDSRGVGLISACPDPDNAGPKVAILRDRNGDGRADLCFQSGYQQKGTAGDLEFHARLNNTSTPGTQTVYWCYDPDMDGCSDEYELRDKITIDWTR